MEKEFIRDPEAAMKKYGEEAMKKIQEKGKEESKEGREGILEKV